MYSMFCYDDWYHCDGEFYNISSANFFCFVSFCFPDIFVSVNDKLDRNSEHFAKLGIYLLNIAFIGLIPSPAHIQATSHHANKWPGGLTRFRTVLGVLKTFHISKLLHKEFDRKIRTLLNIYTRVWQYICAQHMAFGYIYVRCPQNPFVPSHCCGLILAVFSCLFMCHETINNVRWIEQRWRGPTTILNDGDDGNGSGYCQINSNLTHLSRWVSYTDANTRAHMQSAVLSIFWFRPIDHQPGQHKHKSQHRRNDIHLNVPIMQIWLHFLCFFGIPYHPFDHCHDDSWTIMAMLPQLYVLYKSAGLCYTRLNIFFIASLFPSQWVILCTICPVEDVMLTSFSASRFLKYLRKTVASNANVLASHT